MPDINIEEKIQEALKRKSFKENKLEYFALALTFCLILFVTFIGIYFVPFLAPLIFIFVDIPLMMGFKHFIWFGPASGETLLDGFKVSIVCGYLNFISYFKIFFTTNGKPFLIGLLSAMLGQSLGLSFVYSHYGEEMSLVLGKYDVITQEAIDELLNINGLKGWLIGIELGALALGFIVYFIIKLRRAILPYVSFLRLTNLEGKSMDSTLNHTRKMINLNKTNYYVKATLYHLLYLIPIVLGLVTYYCMGLNPVYSVTTVDLISTLVFFVTMSPALLMVELFYRHYCLDINQDLNKEKNMMLNDAINDLNKKNSYKK